MPGQHWVAWLIDARPEGSHTVEYYDPLADSVEVLGKAYGIDVLAQVKKLIKKIHGNETYLRYRYNTITDQSNTSSNCGEFSVHFLQSRLNGKSFGKASGWNAAGERDIELWKKKPAQQLWLSGQTGEGLRDILAITSKAVEEQSKLGLWLMWAPVSSIASSRRLAWLRME